MEGRKEKTGLMDPWRVCVNTGMKRAKDPSAFLKLSVERRENELHHCVCVYIDTCEIELKAPLGGTN